MSLTPIVIVGSSGHAHVVLDIVKLEAKHEVIGFIDTYKPKGSNIYGLEILGDDECIKDLMLSGKVSGAVVAIGDNFVRAQVTERIQRLAPGLQLLSAIHPSATIAGDATIDVGTVVMAGVIVNPGCQIDAGCILNTKASLDHESRMEAFSSLGPGATTGGDVRIGRGSSVGIGANIYHGITVGEGTVVGGGSLVNKNLPCYSVAYGSPAKVVRSRAPNESYL